MNQGPGKGQKSGMVQEPRRGQESLGRGILKHGMGKEPGRSSDLGGGMHKDMTKGRGIEGEYRRAHGRLSGHGHGGQFDKGTGGTRECA